MFSAHLFFPLTHRTSQATCHTSHVERHTSHVTRHTSHVTRHRHALPSAAESSLGPLLSLNDELVYATQLLP